MTTPLPWEEYQQQAQQGGPWEDYQSTDISAGRQQPGRTATAGGARDTRSATDNVRRVMSAANTAVDQADRRVPRHRVGAGEDVARSSLRGLERGALNIINIPGEQANAQGHLANTITAAIMSRLGDPAQARQELAQMDALNDRQHPTTEQLATSPIGTAAGAAYQPQTRVGEVADTATQMLPGALLPGGWLARVGSVLVPTATTEVGREVDRSLGGSGEVGATVGGLGGGFLAGAGTARLARVRPVADEQTAVSAARTLQRFGGTGAADPAAMRTAQAEHAAQGSQPTVADLTTESGRRTIRSANSRAGTSQDAARDFHEGRMSDLPSRVSRQARRIVSTDPRTPDQIAAEIGNTRRIEGDAQFGVVRDTPVSLSDDVRQTLTTPDGRRAMLGARRNLGRSTDPQDRARAGQITDLMRNMADRRAPTMTVGAAQRISEELYNSAEVAARRGDMNGARQFRQLGDAVRDNARTQVPGYDEALTNYAAHSRNQDAVRVGEQLLTHNTDEFVDSVGGMGPDELNSAEAGGRRAIERAAGERGGAPNTARALSGPAVPEQYARTTALIGPEDAASLGDAMRFELRRVQNAADVAPRTGSATTMNARNDSRIAQGVETGLHLAHAAMHPSPMAWFGAAKRFLGMNDADAEALAAAASRPELTDRVLAAIEAQAGRGVAQRFAQLANDPAIQRAAVGGLLASSAAGDGQ